MKKFMKLVAESLVIFAVAAAAGLIFNAMHKDGIPVVAKYEYEIYTDCPEFLAEVDYYKISKAVTVFGQPGTVFVDTRLPEEFAVSHIKGAVNIPYDVLYGIDEQAIAGLDKYELIIVYDDVPTDAEFRPSSALASEIKDNGMENVKYLYEPYEKWVEKGHWTEKGGAS